MSPQVKATWQASQNPAGRNGSSSDFFKTGPVGPRGGKPPRRFVPSLLSEHLRGKTPVAIGGEALYVYEGGAYRPDGEKQLRCRIASLLGGDWKRTYADEVVAHLFAISPRLDDEPPLDRVNCANGILNLATGEIEPHDPALLSPVQIAASFDPGAECLAIHRFIREALPDTEVQQVVWELAPTCSRPTTACSARSCFWAPAPTARAR